MGVETYSTLVIVAKQQQITKLYEKLNSLPEKMDARGSIKYFRDNPEYERQSAPCNNGSFTMSDIITGEAEKIDLGLKDYQFLYIQCLGYNGAWNPELFMSANDIDYVLMVESSSNECEQFEETLTMRNRLTDHYEQVTLPFDDPVNSDDPRYGEKPSEFILYGKRLVDKAMEIHRQMNNES